MTVFKIADFASPQAAINALQAAGGGKLYVDKVYLISTPVIFSGLVPTLVEGDGGETGFTLTSGTNLALCGTATPNVNPGVRFKDLRLALSGGSPSALAILSKNEANPVYENVEFSNFSCATWFVATWAPHFVNSQFEGHTYCCIGFDPATTPANQVILDRCKAYSNNIVMQVNAGCNGVHIINGDYENNATLLDFQPITYVDPADGQLGRCSIIRVEGNDLELMTGQTIASKNTLYGLTFTGNTTSGTHSNDFGNDHVVNGLIYKNNNIHNMAVTIKTANCPGYELGYYDQQSGGSFALV